METEIIEKNVPITELLAGLAEECMELGQAALKLRRVFDGTNPTPVDEKTAIERLYEEMADVAVYEFVLKVNNDDISEKMQFKLKRWAQRLMEVRQ